MLAGIVFKTKEELASLSSELPNRRDQKSLQKRELEPVSRDFYAVGHIHMCTHTHTHIYIHTHAHIHTHTHSHTHTHTHTHTQENPKEMVLHPHLRAAFVQCNREVVVVRVSAGQLSQIIAGASGDYIAKTNVEKFHVTSLQVRVHNPSKLLSMISHVFAARR